MQKNISYFFPLNIPKTCSFSIFFSTLYTSEIKKMYTFRYKDILLFLYSPRKFVICVSLLHFFSFTSILHKKRHAFKKGVFSAYFFLNSPLISNPRFCSSSSSAFSEINSIYLPVPMATQLTASSATIA